MKDNNELLIRKDIIDLALLQYDKPYIWSKHGPESFDCAGLIWYIFNEVLDIDLYDRGIGLSTTTQLMTSYYGLLKLYNEYSDNKNLSSINTGDIVFFHNQSLKSNLPQDNNKYPGHCGIYLSDGKFIHASKKLGRVVISNFHNNDYWKRVLVATKDIASDTKILIKK